MRMRQTAGKIPHDNVDIAVDLERKEEFLRMRRKHPGIESAINSLEYKGDRIASKGRSGFP